jgi:hypothetical protein
VLRRLEERDLPAIMAWDNDEEIIRTMGRKFATHAHCQEWFAEARDGRSRRVLAIEDETGLLIGELELENFNPKAGSVELSICIGEPVYRSRGNGSEAIGLVRDHRRVHDLVQFFHAPGAESRFRQLLPIDCPVRVNDVAAEMLQDFLIHGLARRHQPVGNFVCLDQLRAARDEQLPDRGLAAGNAASEADFQHSILIETTST